MTRPVLIPIAAGAALAVVLALPATDAVHGLQAARAERARLRSVPPSPPPLATDVERGATRADANRSVARRLSTIAQGGGVLVEQVRAGQAPDPLVSVLLNASGSERAVLAFLSTIEREQPALRLRSWRMAAVPGGVRLEADWIAPWSP